jgi:hypothetical protein
VKDGKTTPFQLTAQAGGCLQVVAAVAQEDVTAIRHPLIPYVAERLSRPVYPISKSLALQ